MQPRKVEQYMIDILAKLNFNIDKYNEYVKQRNQPPLSALPKESARCHFLYTAIEDLELPTAAKNILMRRGCRTLAMMLTKSFRSLCDLLEKNGCLYLFEKTQVNQGMVKEQ